MNLSLVSRVRLMLLCPLGLKVEGWQTRSQPCVTARAHSDCEQIQKPCHPATPPDDDFMVDELAYNSQCTARGWQDCF